jgi:hypothetical protein
MKRCFLSQNEARACTRFFSRSHHSFPRATDWVAMPEKNLITWNHNWVDIGAGHFVCLCFLVFCRRPWRISGFSLDRTGKAPLQSIIGLFFLLYGLHVIYNTPRTDYPTLQRRGGIAEFLSTFLVVLLNPTTFIMFSALFTLFGFAKSKYGLLQSLEIALVVFMGAIVFWLIVTQVVQRARGYIDEASFSLLVRLSSYAIALFGTTILLHCVYNYLYLET